MAGNGITYVGRLINNRGQAEFAQSKQGNHVLKLVLAEQHTERNDRAAKKFQDPTKATDAYVPTTTSWHRVTVFGEEATRLATDPDVNHGALMEVVNAQYREEDDWVTKDGVKRAGRPETIGRDSRINVLERNGTRYGARDEHNEPLWDGYSSIPTLKGSGGGGGQTREYSDDEGF